MPRHATVRFRFLKETKHTYRYQEVAEDGPAVMQSVYLAKRVMGTEPPGEVRVIIESGALGSEPARA